jgi:hypothetical protein
MGGSLLLKSHIGSFQPKKVDEKLCRISTLGGIFCMKVTTRLLMAFG